jgi:hypothetical protein
MVELVDSQQEELSVEDIVAIDGMNDGQEYMPTQLVGMLNAELRMPNTLFIRQGNTLFVIHKAKPSVGVFRIINADTEQNLLNNCREFIAACYKMGFDTMGTLFRNREYLKIPVFIMDNPPNEDMGYQLSELDGGQYQLVIQCGPVFGGEK